jgi:hypothetical protein
LHVHMHEKRVGKGEPTNNSENRKMRTERTPTLSQTQRLRGRGSWPRNIHHLTKKTPKGQGE